MPLRLMFVGPSESCQGGVAAMLARIKATALCSGRKCFHYPSVTGSGNGFVRLITSALLLLAFPLFVLAQHPVVIGIHVSSGSSFVRKFGYFCWAKLLRRKVVVHVHPAHFSAYYRSASRPERLAIDCVARHSDWTIFLTEGIAASLRPPFPEERTSVVPNFVSVDEYMKFPRRDDPDRPALLYLGWIIKEKGVYDIVDAMPAVLDRFPGARFVFAGPKEVERLRQLLAERNLDASADVLGWVAGDDKLKLLSSSRLLLLPSYSEGIPNVLLEAMAAGLPAITTPVGGIPEIFHDGINGRFVQPGDPVLLAEAINELLGDRISWARMSCSTAEHVQRSFSRETVEGRLVEVYTRVIG